jgi:exopolysaccharide biosynthesis polyprenyl glycosylphosphotransferase
MTDQIIDVGAIRPGATARSPELSLPERWSTQPQLGIEVLATPVDSPDGPVASVSVVTPQLVIEAAETWRSKASDLAHRGWTALHRRDADVWVVLVCLTVGFAGLATMTLLHSFTNASWVALAASIWVALKARSQLHAGAHVQVVPVVRALALGFATVAVLIALGLGSEADLSAAGWVLIAAGAVITTSLLVRRDLRRPARVVVVGDHAAISRAAMVWSDGSAHVIGGVLTGADESPLQAITGVPTISGLEHAAEWARGRWADLVVVAPGHDLSTQQARQLAWSLERSGIRLAIADLVSDAAPHRVRAGKLGRTTVLELAPTRRGVWTRALKGLVDRVVGSLLLLCAAPLLGVMMALVRLDSPGGPLFKQQRVGRDGTTFTMYKLRTMHVDAERQLITLLDQNEGAGVLFKMQDDPRVTRVGRLLRRTSMDELPQLINVVKGQMSLVGPRPALPCEVEKYDDVERRRLAVKPGITGAWQVSGRSNLDWDTSICLDLDYVDNWRISDDLLIGMRTVGAVMGARGAY